MVEYRMKTASKLAGIGDCLGWVTGRSIPVKERASGEPGDAETENKKNECTGKDETTRK